MTWTNQNSRSMTVRTGHCGRGEPVSPWLYSFPRAAVIKYQAGGWNDRNLLSHGSGRWKVKVKIPVDSVFVKCSFLAYRWLPSHCHYMIFSHGHTSLMCPNLFLWEHPSDGIRTHPSSFILTYLPLKGLISKCSRILRFRLGHTSFGSHSLVHNNTYIPLECFMIITDFSENELGMKMTINIKLQLPDYTLLKNSR